MELTVPKVKRRSGHPQISLTKDILYLDSQLFDWESQLIKKMVKKFQKVWRQISGRLALLERELDPRMADELLDEISGELDLEFATLVHFARGEFSKVSQSVVEHARLSLRTQLGKRIRLSKIRKRSIYDAVDSAIIVDGSRLKDVFEGIKQNAFGAFRKEIVEGVVSGKKTYEMARDLKSFFKESETRRSIDLVIRTASNAISNQVRKSFYADNPSLVKGLRAIATFDLRTTKQCRARNNKVWSLAGVPIGHEIPYNGGAPWHYGCRTVEIPEVNGNAKGISAGSRAAFRGPVPGEFETEDWINQLSDKDRKKYFGPTLYPLWQEGKFSVEMYLDKQGNDRTIAQIKSLLKAP